MWPTRVRPVRTSSRYGKMLAADGPILIKAKAEYGYSQLTVAFLTWPRSRQRQVRDIPHVGHIGSENPFNVPSANR